MIMSQFFSNCVNTRIDEIMENLLKTNSDYALAVEQRKDLYDNFESVFNAGTEITLSAIDFMDLKDLFDCETASASILQKDLYKQGFLDCAKLVKSLLTLTY